MNKKRVNIIILFVYVITTIIGTISYRSGIINPLEQIGLEDIADFCNDDKGNTYLLNNSGYEMVRMNEKNQADLVISGSEEKDDSFMRALHVACDNDGNIYIHQRLASDQALSWIGKENIQVFDKNGDYIKTLDEVVYDTPVLSSPLVNLQCYGGEIYAISKMDNHIEVKDINNDKTVTYELDNAGKVVKSACIDGSILYISTLDGRILKIHENGLEVLWDIKNGQDDSIVLGEITANEKGDVFVCDISNGTILKYVDNQFEPYYEYDGLLYGVDCSYNELFSSSSSIIRNGEEYEALEPILSMKVRSVVCYITYVIAALCLVYIGYLLIVLLLNAKNQMVRLISSFVVVIAVITGCVSTIIAKEFRTTLKDNFVEQAMHTAKLVNQLMDGDAFSRLRSVSDFYSEDYIKIKNVVDTVILDEGIPNDMYLIMYTLEGKEDVVVRYALEEVQGCNYPYIWSDGVDEQTVYKTKKTFLLSDATDSEGDFLCVYSPITNSKGDVVGVIEVGTDSTIFNNVVYEKIQTIIISIVVFSIVTLLILLEVIEFLEAKKQLCIEKVKKGLSKVPLKLYRIIVFLVFFITNITTPFLSIYSLSLSNSYSEMLHIPAEILAAVPISAEVLFGAIFSMLGGSIILKIGKRKSGIIGAIMFTVGLAIRFLWPDLIILTIGNALQGAGWGIVLLIINSFIAAEEDEKLQENGFSDYNIGLQNGINSGIVLGGFLLTFSSYKGILVLVSIISAFVFLLVYRYIFDGPKEKEAVSEDKNVFQDYISFIFNPKILVYFLCIVVPVIAASYYLNFLYPILADRLGMSESFIGYSYLLNGLVIICFGNLIVNVMSKFFNKRILLMLSSLIYLVTFMLIGVLNNITALLISLVLIAISDSFGYVAQSTFYTDLKETEDFGYEKAMGVYSLFENLSQSAGSFIFGYILTVGVKVGMCAYGIVIGVCGVLFAIYMKSVERKKHNEN
ncbi:MAG: MFS transporter [Holdemanella sp.]|nr:MFS transporter [Holdemanella sp.]